jgi:hypothetical protein
MEAVAYVDHLLRNREQVAADMQDESQVHGATKSSFAVFLVLTVFYGFIMGAQSLFGAQHDGWKFAVAGALKLPLLFLATLAVCLPLLYVLNVLIGPRARFRVVLGLLVASLAVTGLVLAACAPILAFFMLSSKSYLFIKLLNVIIFSVAGLYGVWFLGKGLSLVARTSPGSGETAAQAERSVSTIMTWWLITYGIVGTQMAWIMRPFVGSPNLKFALFRAHESSFYENVALTIGKLLGIH